MWTLLVTAFRAKSLGNIYMSSTRDLNECTPFTSQCECAHHVCLRNMFSLCFIWHFSSCSRFFSNSICVCACVVSIAVSAHLQSYAERLKANADGRANARWSQNNNFRVHLSSREFRFGFLLFLHTIFKAWKCSIHVHAKRYHFLCGRLLSICFIFMLHISLTPIYN